MEKIPLISILIILQVTFNDVNLVIAQKPTPQQQAFKCRNNGNFKSDALLKKRDEAFNLLFKYFTPPYYGVAYGATEGTDKVWTMGLCPPDIKMEACRECMNYSIPYLKQNCPKQKEGVAWTHLNTKTCMVCYADSQIRDRYDTWAWHTFSSRNQTAGGDLEKGINDLVNKLKGNAAGTNSITKFSSGAVVYGPNSRNIYGNMQCTPRINKEECSKCLSEASNMIHNCCSKERKVSGVAWSTNCYFRYSHINFTSNA